MKSHSKCPTCNNDIPLGAPDGMCPVCLLAGGNDNSAEEAGEQTSPKEGAQHRSGKDAPSERVITD